MPLQDNIVFYDEIDRKIVKDLDFDRKTTEESTTLEAVMEDRPSNTLEHSECLEDPVTVVERCDLDKVKMNAWNAKVGKLPPVDVNQKLNTQNSATKLRKLTKTEKNLRKNLCNFKSKENQHLLQIYFKWGNQRRL